MVEDFGRTAVYACEKLEEVIFADEQKNLVGKNIDGILFRCPNISKIHLPKKLEVIGRDFCMDSSIREIDFPKKLKEIGECAFHSNPIEYLTFPRSLKTVGDSAFGGALKRVTLYDNLLPNTRYRKERRTSGYPYITAWCVVGYYDRKSDWNWDWDCDFFGGYHNKMTYIQTGGCERIDYEYPFMDEWCDGKFFHEEDAELFEPVDKEGLACKSV